MKRTQAAEIMGMLGGARRHKLEPGQCAYCDSERKNRNEFYPPHDASHGCHSGKRPHCTCDNCW